MDQEKKRGRGRPRGSGAGPQYPEMLRALLPAGWLQALDRQAQREGISRGELVRRALVGLI